MSNFSNTVHLITNNSSLLSTNYADGSCLDTCSFYEGPSDSMILAFGESMENCLTVAYSGDESCGSIAYTGAGESCGSVASASAGASVGINCSYSC